MTWTFDASPAELVVAAAGPGGRDDLDGADLRLGRCGEAEPEGGGQQAPAQRPGE
jgi:hypothetical protein